MAEASEEHGGATFDTRKDAGPGPAGPVKLWLAALDLSSRDEEKWRKAATSVVEKYRAVQKGDAAVPESFNILFSNTETIVPAIYNSEPVPDIRRRFGDADPVGKMAGQVAERAVIYMADQYHLDYALQNAVKDMALPGRGVTRIRYKPVTDHDTGQQHAAVCAEHVQWDEFRRGPGRRWEDVSWIAFRHLLTREQVVGINKKIGATIPLDTTAEGKEKDEEKDAARDHDVFRRLCVWEIWDKDAREVLWIAPSYKAAPLAQEKDQLKLEGFFPIPRPMVAIETTDSLVPIEPFRLYAAQARELDRITERINALIKVIKWRGIRAAGSEEDAFDLLKDAADGELVPAQNLMGMLSSGGGLDKAIWLMPIEQAQKVVTELYAARDQVKQTIYEITGIADILRGSTEASETATAQQIKAQWGSLRIQRLQAEVARYARDLIRMMVEVICTRFDWEALSAMTQTNLPTNQQKAQAEQIAQMAQQAGAEPPPGLAEMLDRPSVEDVLGVLKSDLLRSYRIDVETDSTVRADVSRQQENLSNFVMGFGQFIQAVGPAVEAGVMQVDEATDLLTGFARAFKLGRQAEDALDRLGRRSQEMAANPQPPAPDPEQQKMEMERENLGIEQQDKQARLQMDRQRQEAEMAMAQEKHRNELAMAQQNAAMQQQAAQQEAAFKEREFGLREQEMGVKADLERQKIEDGQMARHEGFAREDAVRKADGLPPATYEDDMGKMADALMMLAQAQQQLAEQLAQNTQAQAEQTQAMMAAMTAPKRIVRGQNGRAEGVQTVLN